jgi:hypothetical protein
VAAVVEAEVVVEPVLPHNNLKPVVSPAVLIVSVIQLEQMVPRKDVLLEFVRMFPVLERLSRAEIVTAVRSMPVVSPVEQKLVFVKLAVSVVLLPQRLSAPRQKVISQSNFVFPSHQIMATVSLSVLGLLPYT